VLRVAAALIPGVYMPGMLAAGTAWTLAFLVYLFAYTPLLLGKRPRRPDAPITLGVARSSGAGA
jgi:uncharacterized protein involved in response to NO